MASPEADPEIEFEGRAVFLAVEGHSGMEMWVAKGLVLSEVL